MYTFIYIFANLKTNCMQLQHYFTLQLNGTSLALCNMV